MILSNHPHMGKISHADRVVAAGMNPGHARRIIILLIFCTALQMISYGMIFPLFARKIGDFGDGIEMLATSLMVFSLAGIIASPIMGSLADRFGRKLLLIGSLAVFSFCFIGYYYSITSVMFIVIRGLAGALTAGFWPSTMGVVADISPGEERARWIGIINAGISVGWIVGPAFGGWLFDKWGYGVPFLTAICMVSITCLVMLFFLPETYTKKDRQRAMLYKKRAKSPASDASAVSPILSAFPRPISMFLILLFVNLSLIFAWFFIDPHLPLYVFEELGWSTAQFGSTISFYGWAMLLGSLILGQASDRLGRKSILVVGLVLHSVQYLGLMLTQKYWAIVIAFMIAGLGESLINPALSASFLDITPEENRARVMGIKAAVGSLGSLLAPALVMIVIRFIPSQSVFLVSAVLILFTGLLVLVALRIPSRAIEVKDRVWEISQERIIAAQSALNNVVISASAARNMK